MIFAILTTLFLCVALEQKLLVKVKKKWQLNLRDVRGLVSVFQGRDYKWLNNYSFHAYVNGKHFRQYLDRDASVFSMMLVSIEAVLNYRTYAMKVLIIEAVFMRVVSEILMYKSFEDTIFMDLSLIGLPLVSWVAGGQIAWIKSSTSGSRWHRILVSGYYERRAFDYWSSEASLFGKQHVQYMGLDVIAIERLKNFYALAQILLLVIFVLGAVMGNSSRIASYIN